MANELYHFGILGQKWGVRRFQNEDRTWTDAGKIRYGDGTSGSSNASEDHKSAHSGKKMEQMSTKQLQAHNARLNAQKQYKQLHEKNGTVKKAMKFVAGCAAPLGAYVGLKSNFKNVFGVDLQKAVSDGANAIADVLLVKTGVGRKIAPLAAAVSLNANVGNTRPEIVSESDPHRTRLR